MQRARLVHVVGAVLLATCSGACGDDDAAPSDGAGPGLDAGRNDAGMRGDAGPTGSDAGDVTRDAGTTTPVDASRPVSTHNLYVTPSGAGAHDGSSWNDALGGLAELTFTGAHALVAGTTLWMAGGAYPGSLSIDGNGTATERLVIRRATASSVECASAAGWSAAYDAQVVIGGGASVTPIVIPGGGGGGDYFTLDGQVPDGIQLLGADDDGGGIVYEMPASHVELTYLDIAGATGASSHTFRGDARGIDATPAAPAQGLVISHCRIHGFPNLIYTANFTDVLVEHTALFDNGAANSAMYHPNVYISVATSDVVFRYNDVSGWTAEGILLWGGTPQTNWKIYGNVFHDREDGAYARALEIQNGTHGPITFHDNTLVNMWLAVLDDSGGGVFASGSAARNNIYFAGPGWGTDALDRDYTYTDGDSSDVHGVAHGADPFVSLAGGDYHLGAATGAMSARDTGVALDAEYATDRDGHARGADGSWDIGAYEH